MKICDAESSKQTENKTFVLWLDYLPPSGNTMMSAKRSRVMEMKKEARLAWSLALYASGHGPVMTTICNSDANGSVMPLLPVLESTTETRDLSGSINNSKLQGLKA